MTYVLRCWYSSYSGFNIFNINWIIVMKYYLLQSLFVWGVSSHSRIFHPHGDVNIAGEEVFMVYLKFTISSFYFPKDVATKINSLIWSSRLMIYPCLLKVHTCISKCLNPLCKRFLIISVLFSMLIMYSLWCIFYRS